MIYEQSLKQLKEKYKNTEVVDIINELAVQRGFLKVHPFLSMKTINEIIQKKNLDFQFVDLIQTDVVEGSMAMEFCYDLIFKDLHNHNLYGAQLYEIPKVNGELWDDFIANEDEEDVEIKRVKEEKETKTTYKFQ